MCGLQIDACNLQTHRGSSFVDRVPMEHWAQGLPRFSARLAADVDLLQDEVGPDSPDDLG